MDGAAGVASRHQGTACRSIHQHCGLRQPYQHANETGCRNSGSNKKIAGDAGKLTERVTGLAHEVSNITGLNRVDWQVSHAEHLIRAAHQRLVLTSDVEGAYALLDAADKVVGDIKEIGTINVRRAFAKNLNDLSVASRVDIDGIFVKLDALQDQITQLSVPSLGFEASKADIKEAEDGADFSTKVSIAAMNLLSAITAQYDIQQLDEPVKPLLTTDQRSHLKQNLALLVEQAQLAAIKGHAKVYSRLLSQAEAWVRGHFNLDTPNAQVLLSTFKQLSAVELSPEIPDISESMRALKVFSTVWNKEKEIRQASVGKELMDAGIIEKPVDQKAPLDGATGETVKAESVSEAPVSSDTPIASGTPIAPEKEEPAP
ncbi:MAG: uroporphyrinogen-III C-methyltransferase [Pseudomonadales bacterium]|nr:uroporphyrinogen-III C-methyltransferase [Pseudomonadales bacterium]